MGGDMKPKGIFGSKKKLMRLASKKQYKPIKDRIYAVIFFKSKMSFAKIAKTLGHVINWARKWIERYYDGGVANLFDKPRPGRSKILPENNEESFVERLSKGPQADDPTSVFTGVEIRKILEDEYDSSYSVSGLYALLHRLKLSRKKPRPCHYKQDSKEVEEWKSELPEVIKKITREQKGREIEIWYQDEARYGNQGEIAPVWSPIGLQPIVKKQNGRRNGYIFGAINPFSGAHRAFITPECSTASMNIHLQDISESLSQKAHAIIIMDGASWHEKSQTIIVPENISIITLPPYSPELNPIERLWKFIKNKKLKNRVIPASMDMNDLGCELWNVVNSKLVKSLCAVNYLPFTN